MSVERPTRAPGKSSTTAHVLLGLLLALIVVAPILLVPGIGAIGIINVIRYIRRIMDGTANSLTIVLMIANGLAATVTMLIFIVMSRPA
jgi:uncharacterized membrane protein YidH (DUF202 family)